MPAFGQNSVSQLGSMVDLEEVVTDQDSVKEEIKGACKDTPGFTNGHGHGCASYQKSWCANGKAKPGMEWALGPNWNFPEANCCVCGKGPSCAGHCGEKCEMITSAFTAQADGTCKLTDYYWNFQTSPTIIRSVGTPDHPKWSLYANAVHNANVQVFLGTCTQARACVCGRLAHTHTRRQRLLSVRGSWEGAV